MILVLNAEQEEFKTSLRRFVTEQASLKHIRATQDAGEGFDKGTWQKLATDLGIAGVLISEEHGGWGSEDAVVLASVIQQELGRGLVPSPFYSSSVISASVLNAAGDADAAAQLLPGIASGEKLVSFAATEGPDSWIPASVSTTAEKSGDGWVLQGQKSLVLDAQTASSFIVLASTSEGEALFIVDAGAEGLSVIPLSVLDRGRSAARVELRDVKATKINASDVAATLAKTDSVASVLLAAEQYGALDHALEITTEYAKVRVQFARPIGSFQGVKHQLSDMAMNTELAYSILRQAAWAGDHSPEEFPVAALAAYVNLSNVHFDGAARMIQLHGGIGFTWEHDAHLFYKHAKTAQLLLGTPGKRRALLADRLGI
jgi:alkylation response protein AidB-like acyl-CoA dehydrogenase